MRLFIFIGLLFFSASLFAAGEQLAITTPQNQQTIWSNTGDVTVQTNSAASPKDTYELFLDGKLINTQSSPNFKLHGVTRGAHQLQVRLLDQQKNILSTSSVITFYLQQARVKHVH